MRSRGKWPALYPLPLECLPQLAGDHFAPRLGPTGLRQLDLRPLLPLSLSLELSLLLNLTTWSSQEASRLYRLVGHWCAANDSVSTTSSLQISSGPWAASKGLWPTSYPSCSQHTPGRRWGGDGLNLSSLVQNAPPLPDNSPAWPPSHCLP